MWMTSPEPLSSTLLNHQTRKVQNSSLGEPAPAAGTEARPDLVFRELAITVQIELS
jgi:hypothetical protein